MKLAIVMALLSALGTALAAETAPDEPAVKVVCFGDSITFGYKLEKRRAECYPALLGMLLDEKPGGVEYTVVNAGVSGEDTRQGLRRIEKLLKDERPRWILIQYGTNDLWTSRDIAPGETRQNLHEMVRRAREADAEVLIATLVPVWDTAAKVAARNEIIRSVAEKEGIPLVDLNAAMTKAVEAAGGLDDKNAWLKYYMWSRGDEGVHPNAEGYRLLTSVWFKALEAAIDGGKTSAAGEPSS
jgi:lysophospholipase L1-like esterase